MKKSKKGKLDFKKVTVLDFNSLQKVSGGTYPIDFGSITCPPTDTIPYVNPYTYPYQTVSRTESSQACLESTACGETNSSRACNGNGAVVHLP